MSRLNLIIEKHVERYLKENPPVHKVFKAPVATAKTEPVATAKTQPATPTAGNKNLNPDTDEGRVNLIKALALEIKDLQTRAQILNKQIEKALSAENRQEFKEQLILLSDGLVSLKKQIEKLNQIYLITVKNYEKQRGRDIPVSV